jgi:branched-chain amino acid transport system permease protein
VQPLIALLTRHRVLAVIAFLLVFPWIMPYSALAVNVLIFGLFAVGLNVLFGYTGLLSFGHAAFLGVGGYLTGISMLSFGWPWWIALFVGVVASALVGLAMGWLAIRSRGIYFSMVTLALAQCVYFIFYKAERWTGGENGLRGIKIEPVQVAGFTFDLLNPITKYYFMLAFVALALWLVSRLLASPFGAVMETIRENEKRAAACGFDVARSKLLAFVLSAAICGLAGGLRAIHLSIVPIDSLHYLTSGQAIMMCLLGGMGTFFGPFVGAAAFLLIEEGATNFTKHWQLVTGIVFIVFVLFFPKGIWGSMLERMKRL